MVILILIQLLASGTDKIAFSVGFLSYFLIVEISIFYPDKFGIDRLRHRQMWAAFFGLVAYVVAKIILETSL